MPRVTRQQQAICQVFEQADRPLLAQEVLNMAHQQVPQLGLATVYRNLKQLVENNTLKVVSLPGENPRYELASHPHHHHFYCRQCERVFDIHGCPGSFEELLPEGFSVDAHDLTLYGLCQQCRQAV